MRAPRFGKDPSLDPSVETCQSLRRGGRELNEVRHAANASSYSMPRRFLTSATGIGASPLALNFANAARPTAASRRSSSSLVRAVTTGAGFALEVGRWADLEAFIAKD
jgi:hypothetical protein